MLSHTAIGVRVREQGLWDAVSALECHQSSLLWVSSCGLAVTLRFDQTFSEQAAALQDLCSFAHTLEVAMENAGSSYELALAGADEKCQAIECTHDDVIVRLYKAPTFV